MVKAADAQNGLIVSRCNVDRVACAAFALAFAAYVFRRLLWLQSESPAYCGALSDVAGVFAALILLLVALFAIRVERGYALRAGLIGASLGVAYFVSTIGIGLADPTNVDWLMRGDWAQHFLGWHFFRSSAWAWPLGAFNSFWYPIGTSVVYTDSLPLVALPLKLFSEELPARFQYIGTWIFFNCVLQGVFGALLMRCFTTRVSVQAIGTAFLLVTPVFISRAAHDTLTTQWLLLASLWMYFRNSDPHRAYVTWLALGSISALVHPYLCVMVLGLMCAYYSQVYFLRSLQWKTIFAHVLIVALAVLFLWWISGTFIIKIRSGFEFGANSANLLTWFNAETFSRWLPALPQIDAAQFEGVGYLGLGVLVLGGMAIALALFVRPLAPSPSRALTPLIVVVTLMTIFAFSTRLTFGSIVLADFTPKHLQLLGALRASGRFIWPSVYLITVLAVVTVATRAKRFALPVLVVAFFIQMLDLAPLQIAHARMREGVFQRQQESVLQSTYWNEVVRGKQHIVLFPASECGVEAAPYFPFSLLAADNRMTINTGYLARFDGIRREKYCMDLRDELERGERDDRTLYIVSKDVLTHFVATSAKKVECREVENYQACITEN